MSSDPTFKMSQDFELVQPEKKRAYPIIIEEWEYLKTKVKNICDNSNTYHTIGSALLGVAGSAFVTALTLTPQQTDETAVTIKILLPWCIFAISSICGLLSYFFGRTQRNIQNTTASDVIEHMDLIEKRYPNQEA